jgi:hypothetical protein
MDQEIGKSIKAVGIPSNQAARIISRFGSQNRLAVLMSETSGAVFRQSNIRGWLVKRGFIPPEYHQVVYDAAKAAGIDLTLKDFASFPDDHPLMTEGQE